MELEKLQDNYWQQQHHTTIYWSNFYTFHSGYNNIMPDTEINILIHRLIILQTIFNMYHSCGSSNSVDNVMWHYLQSTQSTVWVLAATRQCLETTLVRIFTKDQSQIITAKVSSQTSSLATDNLSFSSIIYRQFKWVKKFCNGSTEHHVLNKTNK